MADFVVVRNDKGTEKRISSRSWQLLASGTNTSNTRKGWTLVGDAPGKAGVKAPPTSAVERASSFLPPEIQEAQDKAFEAEQKIEAALISAEPEAQGEAAPVTEAPVVPGVADAGVEAPAPAKEAKPAEPVVKGDNLTGIDGITGKVQTILNGTGISTFKELAATPISIINKALDEAGMKAKSALVPTWKQKAKELASK